MKNSKQPAARLLALLFLYLIVPGCTKENNDNPSSEKSSDKKISSFSFIIDGTAVNASIANNSIIVLVPYGTNVNTLTPKIDIHAKATINPAIGTSQDFSKEVMYTVTAEDGSTTTYTVTVKFVSPAPLALDCASLPAVLEDRSSEVDYTISCAVKLTAGKILTIKPGVRIQFIGATSGIAINSNDAALKMVGTAQKPIILEGKTASAGSWTGIELNSKNTENQWEYVTIQHAGAGANAAALFINDDEYFLHNAKISVKNCTFKNNKGNGIRDLDNGFNYDRVIFSAFSRNNFSDNTGAPLNITINNIGMLDAQSNYGNNGLDYIEVHGKRGLFSNVTVQKLSVPYYIFESIGIYQRLTISAGVTMQFHTDAGFNLDKQYIGKGTFIANGTSASPIRFIGYKSGKAVWLGLSLMNNDPELLLNYCIIDGAGSNLHSNAACIGNKKAGVNFGVCDYTAKPVATNCTITNSGGYGIVYKKTAVVNFSGNSYSGNTLANENSF